MTAYVKGLWYGWNGGSCPVHPETIVRVMFDNGSGKSRQLRASVLDWDHQEQPVVAFKVVKEYKEPREWWVLFSPSRLIIGNFTEQEAHNKNKTLFRGEGEVVHVREVTTR